VGDRGTILQYDGTEWSVMSSNTTEDLGGVWGASGTDVFAVGDRGTILQYDGTEWSVMSSNTTEELNGIWGASGTDVFAVGDRGTILHYNGSGWSGMSSTTKVHLNGIWGTSGTDVFGLGDGGTILHYDGSSWEQTDANTKEGFMDVWGASATEVFICGDHGGILYYDGSAVSSMRQPGASWNCVTDLEFDPENSDVVYASTLAAGIYISPKQAKRWQIIGKPDYDVYAIFTSSLYAATQGGVQGCMNGWIEGDIRDIHDGSRITDADVFTDTGVNGSVHPDGYILICSPGIFKVTAAADGYAAKKEKNVSVPEGGCTSLDFFLTRKLVVKVRSPVSREVLRSGDNYKVRWSIKDEESIVDRIRLWYSKNAGKKWIKIKNLSANARRHFWTVPQVPKTKKKCKIRVAPYDAEGRRVGNATNKGYFKIRP
jgi:hypothetical protein